MYTAKSRSVYGFVFNSVKYLQQFVGGIQTMFSLSVRIAAAGSKSRVFRCNIKSTTSTVCVFVCISLCVILV